jgi:hypothetical protein
VTGYWQGAWKQLIANAVLCQGKCAGGDVWRPWVLAEFQTRCRSAFEELLDSQSRDGMRRMGRSHSAC